MRIAVMGAGGQGCFFGSLFVQADHDVTFIARGRNLDAMQKNGLTLRSTTFKEITVPVNATDQPEDVGTVDLVLFSVKTYDLDEAVDQIRPLIGPETIILTIQNGVEAADRIGKVVGSEHLLGGVSYTNSHLVAPGVVNHVTGSRLVFGELSGGVSPRVKKLAKVFGEAGLEAVPVDDIRGELWRKFVWQCGLSGVLCLTRLSIGSIRDFKETWELMRMVILEATSVARAEGVIITEDDVDTTLEILSNLPSGVKPSMLSDLESGRRIELEAFNGAIVRFGRKHGVDTPLNYAIYSALKPYENGGPAPQT